MLPPTLASRGGSGLSLSFLRPFLLGRRELAAGIKRTWRLETPRRDAVQAAPRNGSHLLSARQSPRLPPRTPPSNPIGRRTGRPANRLQDKNKQEGEFV